MLEKVIKEREVFIVKKMLISIIVCSMLLVGCGSNTPSEENLIQVTDTNSSVVKEVNISEETAEEKESVTENTKEEAPKTEMYNCTTINLDEKKIDTHSELSKSFKNNE